jgi:hypothetical protein
LRAARGRFVMAAALLISGGLVVFLSANWRNKVIAPGSLASPHAQLFNRGQEIAKCAACHDAADSSAAEWTASLVAGHHERPTQSQLCLECHEKSIEPALALTAHNLPQERLLQLTGASSPAPRSVVASVIRAATSPGNELACAACHREHHGREFDLTAMDNTACQACHQKRYESFVSDHPDFGDWPHERRTRIAFSHASHRAKHFAEKNVAFDCRSCHVEDTAGDVQLTLSFEAACATCHDEKIATSVARGIPMFVLPTLDVDALREAGHHIGLWPEEATGDFDGRLPPAMKLLLAADRPAADAMIALGADFEFQDVDPDDPVQLVACAVLATAIRDLMGDIGRRGPSAVRERLATALWTHVRDPDVSALTAGLSADTMRSAAGWLPGVEVGTEAWPRTAPTAPPAGKGLAAPRVPSFGPAAEWSADKATLSVRYRPASHADPVLASWLELLATATHFEFHPVANAAFKELSSPTAPGLCISCHSLEQSTPNRLTVNWRAYDRAAESRAFTKFAHGPHLVLPQLADCTQCHRINNSADTSTSYTDFDPDHFTSEFSPMSKQQCAGCHTKSAAGDRCQSCHNYHVSLESLGARLRSTPATQHRRQWVKTSSGTRPAHR